MKKLVALFLAIMLVSVSAIVLAEAPEGYPEVVEGIDFGGKEIFIYDYWTNTAERKADPSEEEAAQYAYRDWIEATYNCKITQIADGDWTTNVTQLTNFVTTPDGSYRIYILPLDWVNGPMNNNACAVWNGEGAIIDLTDKLWNQADVEFMTVGGKVYGVSTGVSEPRQCLFFNKRVLEEAGIDWNTIYDMQKDGTWTFEAFEDLLKKIHRDTNNDGEVDVYGMTGSNVDMYRVAVFNNGGKFFDVDENGKLFIAAGSDNTTEALTWSKDIFNNYFYQQPDGGNWDYYKEAWKQGFCGFYMYSTYGGFNDSAELDDAEDWGCVFFPKGPKGDTYYHIASDNISVIPNVYTDDVVAKLAYIYSLWFSDTPGFDDEDAWIGNKYDKTDERAVDETYASMRMSEHTAADKCLLMGSINDIEGADYLWSLPYSTPAELLEAKTPVWQALVDALNAK